MGPFAYCTHHDHGRTTDEQTAAEIVNNVMKKLVSLCVEGAKVYDLCVEGDKLLEAGTGAVYNKSVKGVKVSKGASSSVFCARRSGEVLI